MSKTLMGTEHPHYFYLCFNILSIFPPTTQLFLLYVCFSDSVSGSAHYCWGDCLLSGRSWVHGALEMQLSQLSCFSWWQCLSLEWYPTPPQPGRKEAQQMVRPFWMSASWPHTISLPEFCFWKDVSEYSLLCLQFQWIGFSMTWRASLSLERLLVWQMC